MICSKISSDIAELNRLHEIHPWIPNERQIRPTNEMLMAKFNHTKYVLDTWASFKDYILNTVFHYPTTITNERINVVNHMKNEWAFVKSEFPYDLGSEVNHWVLWNSKYDIYKEFDDKQINEMLEDTLHQIVGSDEVDFAWYVNPKPSIPELWHCQVFWVRK